MFSLYCSSILSVTNLNYPSNGLISLKLLFLRKIQIFYTLGSFIDFNRYIVYPFYLYSSSIVLLQSSDHNYHKIYQPSDDVSFVRVFIDDITMVQD